MASDNHIIRSAIATPKAQNYYSKVVEKDTMNDKFVGGIILDPKNKEHKEFIQKLTDIENSCRKEADHEEVKVTTALKTGNYKVGDDIVKVKYIKALTDFEPDTACKVNGWSPLKYDPYRDDQIMLAVSPAYNLGKMNPNHRGLKLRLQQLAIVEEGDFKQNKKAEREEGGGRSNLLGIELPTSIEADSKPDTGEEIGEFVL